MRKTFIPMLVLLAWATSLPAQITREQADEIVLDYIQNEVNRPVFLYVNINAPDKEGTEITTSNEEKIKAKYACWVYCLTECVCNPLEYRLPFWSRYLFVKEDDGNLLEVIANKDLGPKDLTSSWEVMKTPSSLFASKENNKSLHPNPVNDLLTLPCNGESTRVEIYDLKGTRLFAGTLSGEDACRLDVSFLSAGVYMVKVEGENFKIIKN